MYQEYKVPSYANHAFTCPHCGIYALQSWQVAHKKQIIDFAECASCNRITIWHGKELIYPSFGSFAPPHPLLKGDALLYFHKASRLALVNSSTACSFVREAMRHLFIELGATGTNSDDDVAYLIDNKLGSRKFFDSFRTAKIFGHDKIEPLLINESDDEAMLALLVYLINKLVEIAIAEPIFLAKLMAKLTNQEAKELKKLEKNKIINPDFYGEP